MLRDPEFIGKYSEGAVAEIAAKTEEVAEKQPSEEHIRVQGTCFSNLSNHPVIAYGLEFPTTEHLFHAMKFQITDEAHFLKIAKASTPAEAKELGKSRSNPLRPDWSQVKDDVMLFCIQLKVLAHKDVADELRKTGTKEIVEECPIDYYWGCGKTGTGKN